MFDSSGREFDFELVVLRLDVTGGDDIVDVEGQLYRARCHHQGGTAHHPLEPKERLQRSSCQEQCENRCIGLVR